MAKNLASKLRTGAMVGLAALAVAAPMKAKGSLSISYDQAITEIDTNSDGIKDSYLSTLTMNNTTFDPEITTENSSYFMLNMSADLAGRGCTGLRTDQLNWTYETTGEDTGRFIVPSSGGWALAPATADNFYFTIPKDQVLGWETVNASMVANAGTVDFTLQAPIAIPEPMALTLFGIGGLAALAGRRIKENYRRY